jgi:carbon storage regulator
VLILSRKMGESIIIHEDIVVTVIDIRGGQVRLGIEAPRDVPVYRREVYDAIKRSEGLRVESPDSAPSSE